MAFRIVPGVNLRRVKHMRLLGYHNSYLRKPFPIRLDSFHVTAGYDIHLFSLTQMFTLAHWSLGEEVIGQQPLELYNVRKNQCRKLFCPLKSLASCIQTTTRKFLIATHL